VSEGEASIMPVGEGAAPAPSPPHATEEPPPRSELPESGHAALFFRMSAERLRGRSIAAGVALVVSVVLPYQIVDNHPLFLWELAAELPPAGAVSAFAPLVFGLALVALGLRSSSREGLVVERPSSRAIAVMATLATLAIVTRIGSDAAAWELLPVPESFVSRPAPALLALALASGGAVLTGRPNARKAGRALLALSLVSALFFYLWPGRREAPGKVLVRALSALVDLPDVRLQIGMGVLVLLAAWPMLVALAGLVHLRKTARGDHPPVAILGQWGMPFLLLMLSAQGVLAGGSGMGLVVGIATTVVLLLSVLLLSSALEVLGESLVSPDALLETVGGLRPRVAGAIAAGAVVALSAAMLVLARPPKKGVEWKLVPATPEAEELFGHAIPSWDRARSVRDRRAKEENAGASAMLASKKYARSMVEQAKKLDKGGPLADALEKLADESSELDLAGRRFLRLVGDVNEASREAGLPFYLDPNVRLAEEKDGITRTFYVTPYRIEAVSRYRVGSDEFATLRARSLAGRSSHLGFSRDMDAFAIVQSDEIDRYADEMRLWGGLSGREPHCGPYLANVSWDAELALRRCGVALKALLDKPDLELGKAVAEATERHELQHQIDGPHLPLAGAVADLMVGYARESQDRVNRELSAYLAEMTIGKPQLTLVHLFPSGVAKSSGPSHRVSLLVHEALSGKKLHFATRDVKLEAMTKAFEELVVASDDDLKRKAREAHERLFGQKLAEPERL
jgi:hypothetical protein